MGAEPVPGFFFAIECRQSRWRRLLCGGFGEVLFVDRRKLAQAGDGGGDEFERGVDVGVGVLAGELEAQAGAGAGERQIPWP